MYIARKNASTTDERSRGLDSQDPFALSEIPVAGAIVNPIVAPVSSTVVTPTLPTLNTNTIGYGAFSAQDTMDHYQFMAMPGKTYSLVVTTDFANPNIRTQAFGDYFDIYFEDATGARLTQGFQIKELDAKTKLVEFTIPGTGTTATPYYVQVDNAFGQPFDYAIALYDKSVTPKIKVSAVEAPTATGTSFQVTFALENSDMTLASVRPRMDRVEVTGGTLSSPVRSSDGKAYTAIFTPAAGSGDGLGSIKVLSGAFFTTAGDPNLDGDEANNTAALTLDTTPPKLLSVTSSEAALGPSSKPTLTFNFSEPVLGFAPSDVNVTGGTLSNFQGTGKTYTAVLTPNNGASTVKVDVAKGSVTDTAFKKNASVEDFTTSFAVDIVGPKATITVDKRTVTPSQTATVTITFDEAVKGFELADLTASAGVLSDLTAVGTEGKVYTATLTPPATGNTNTVVVSLAAGSVTDLVGNAVARAESPTVTVDRSPAVVSFTASENVLARGKTATITVVLSEPSNDFTSGDIVPTGGLISNFVASTDRKTYTATFTPADNTETAASLSIGAGTFTNPSGQGNNSASKLDLTVDTKLPTVTIASDSPLLNPESTATLTLTFSEKVLGLSPDDLLAVDGTLTDLRPVGTDGKVYEVTLTTTTTRNPKIEVTLRQDAITDSVGNKLMSAQKFTQDVDYSPRVASLTVDDQEVGASDTAFVSIELTEAVTNLTIEDLEAVGGTIVSFFGEGKSYVAEFQPITDKGFDEEGSVTVKAGSFSTSNGSNRSAATVKFQVDNIAPTISITSSDLTLNKGETAMIAFKLSEASTDFDVEDISVKNGTLSNFQGSGDNYTATFTPVDNTTATASLQVVAGKFADSFGNLNARGATRFLNVDTTKTATPPSGGGDTGGGTGGGTTPPASGVTKLALVEQAVVVGNDVVFTVEDVASANTKLTFADTETNTDVKKDGTVTKFTPEASDVIEAGALVVTNGTDSVDLGLDLMLGTDGADTLSYVDPDPVIDEETGEPVLVATALFGFGGDDVLTEGESTAFMVGGEGIDQYQLTVGLDAPTTIVEAGSPLTAELFAIPGLIESFYGYDMVRGFDVSSDTLVMDKAVKLRGTFIEGYDAFVIGEQGSDLLVFTDANENGVAEAGELGVLLVGVGASADVVNVVGGTGG